MKTETRAGESRPSLVPGEELGRRGLFLMIASWLLVIQGLHALILMLEDVMDGAATWPVWSYTAVAALCLVGGGVLFTSRRGADFVAAAAAAVAGFAIFPPRFSGFVVFAAFAVTELIMLGLGFGAAGHREAIQLASAAIPWRVKLTIVQVVIAIVVIRVFLALDFDLVWIRENWWNIVARGLPLTLFISLVAIILAIVFALFGALGRLSRNPVAYGAAGFYTSFFRGTPLLVQLFLVFFGVAEIGVRMRGTPLEAFGNLIILTPVQVAVIAIGLNYGAYMTEIFRAGIQSVGHGQAEAADALGMSYGQRMRRIVLPQAVRVIIPPTGNEFIAMTKDSSLAFTIGALELFRRADLAGRADARTFEAFLIAAAAYWAFTGVLTFFQARLERKMGRGYVRTGEAGTKRTARKRALLPRPEGPASQPGVTFVPGAGAGGPGGGAGGSLILEDDEAGERFIGMQGTSSVDDADEGADER
jgi:polar amino acid transport system permease protein